MNEAGLDLDGFRASARDWLEHNAPERLRGVPELVTEVIASGAELPPDIELWKRRLATKGWGVPTWPIVYGGGGLGPPAARVLAEEMARMGTGNPMSGIGASMLGPTLLEYGTEDQKQRHLPPIARGETRWCECYSEPSAGSDLASLQMRCDDAGDHWLINGHKIWTSGAQFADWGFCLVRTDRLRKHEGISFVLVDMSQPGVDVRPIPLISGLSPFCETFFTDAVARKDDMVGPLNGGWTIGKRLLQHERSSQGGARTAGVVGSLAELGRGYVGVDTAGRLADGDLRGRLARHMMDAQAHALTMARIAAEARGAGGPGPAASIMKLSSTRIGQERSELALEILGAQGLGWEGDPFTPAELAAVQGWLWGKATTIAGGSAEIQHNIIAKRILGLPDPAGS
ncbi:MAG TPA: acyl-CoA dehydrogenase family protein [Caulobacteraceae bacterium]|nr:acyl-CoA dehydrogenase family protein [Caulobacteraceae bacterium]